MKNRPISIIVAADELNAIGKNGDLLCYLPNDLRHFKQITQGHTVVMGRRTFESLPKGALPNRHNIVITSADEAKFAGCTVVRSLDEAINIDKTNNQLFIIGGGKLYSSAMDITDTIYLTRIHHTFADADTFFPEIDQQHWQLVEKEEHDADDRHAHAYTFMKYIRKQPDNG